MGPRPARAVRAQPPAEERLSAKKLTLRRQLTTLIVGEAHPPTTELTVDLIAQDTVLLHEVIDDGLLPSGTHPANVGSRKCSGVTGSIERKDHRLTPARQRRRPDPSAVRSPTGGPHPGSTAWAELSDTTAFR